MYRAIRELVPDAAFAIFTGDIVDHAVWNTSRRYNEATGELAAGGIAASWMDIQMQSPAYAAVCGAPSFGS